MAAAPSPIPALRLKLAIALALASGLTFLVAARHPDLLVLASALTGFAWAAGASVAVDAALVMQRTRPGSAMLPCLAALPFVNVGLYWAALGWQRDRDAAEAELAALQAAAAARERARARAAAKPPAAPPPSALQGARNQVDLAAFETILPAIKGDGHAGREERVSAELTVRGGARIGADDPSAPLIRTTRDGFLVVYMVDRGDRYTWLTMGELAAWGRTDEEAHRVAMSNLSRLATELRCATEPDSYSGLFLGGRYESSMILLDELWDLNLRPLTPAGAIVSIAARDICAFCDAEDARALAELRTLGARLRARGTQPSMLITDRLYRRQDGRWRPLLDA
ncbi:hypothetical protein [Scleromatobacter humisilvae]|uniref:Uncharacterized protein n=1 Tax=Scleromatobacter humisilvae TaxID=2897159 RepID=A0A9X2C349_9BURK|nr:hypothetical protein [Scleromatobacter humisilvae]MCK9689626.1 hypothetical protein [Scleromatobacter humisilvae]